MTFSIVVREPCEDEEATRFGIGVTTNNPGVGIFCPFVSENGAVCAQYGTHGDVGPAVLDRLDDGAAAPDALGASLDETELTPALQVHALCENARAVHHGENLSEYHSDTAKEFGDTTGENYSVAGNLLASLDTLTAAGETFEEASRDRELADRLIEALVAGDETGGDAREADARSAAVLVADPTAGIANEWYNNIRVDASPTPLADLRGQYELAKPHHDSASEEWS